jgi:hypothetical protein
MHLRLSSASEQVFLSLLANRLQARERWLRVLRGIDVPQRCVGRSPYPLSKALTPPEFEIQIFIYCF